jgi:putative transposase
MTKRVSESKIIEIINRVDAGMTVTEVCRQEGISPATYYKWKGKFGGMEVSDIKRMRQIEDENRRLKNMVAGLMLENDAIKGVLQKKW